MRFWSSSPFRPPRVRKRISGFHVRVSKTLALARARAENTLPRTFIVTTVWTMRPMRSCGHVGGWFSVVPGKNTLAEWCMNMLYAFERAQARACVRAFRHTTNRPPKQTMHAPHTTTQLHTIDALGSKPKVHRRRRRRASKVSKQLQYICESRPSWPPPHP